MDIFLKTEGLEVSIREKDVLIKYGDKYYFCDDELTVLQDGNVIDEKVYYRRK